MFLTLFIYLVSQRSIDFSVCLWLNKEREKVLFNDKKRDKKNMGQTQKKNVFWKKGTYLLKSSLDILKPWDLFNS